MSVRWRLQCKMECRTLLDQTICTEETAVAMCASTCARLTVRELGPVCRHTNTQNAEEAKKSWKDGRKYTLTLVQPNGEQLGLIARYMEEVGLWECTETHHKRCSASTPRSMSATCPPCQRKRRLDKGPIPRVTSHTLHPALQLHVHCSHQPFTPVPCSRMLGVVEPVCFQERRVWRASCLSSADAQSS